VKEKRVVDDGMMTERKRDLWDADAGDSRRVLKKNDKEKEEVLVEYTGGGLHGEQERCTVRKEVKGEKKQESQRTQKYHWASRPEEGRFSCKLGLPKKKT